MSGTGLSAATEPAAPKFHATVEEVVKALLHDVFLLVQPTLTRAVRAIFVIVFGDSEWLARYKSYLGPSMQEFAVDDGRAFDLCVSSACVCDAVAFCSWWHCLCSSPLLLPYTVFDTAAFADAFIHFRFATLCPLTPPPLPLQLLAGGGAAGQHIRRRAARPRPPPHTARPRAPKAAAAREERVHDAQLGEPRVFCDGFRVPARDHVCG